MLEKKQLKLYHGGFGRYEDFTAAENEEEAVKNIAEKLSIQMLPVEAKEIKLEGFEITVKPSK